MHGWERQQKGPQAWPLVDRPYITLVRPLGKIVLLVAVRNDAFDLISSSLFLTTARKSSFGPQASFPNQNPKFRSRGPSMPLPFTQLPRVCPDAAALLSAPCAINGDVANDVSGHKFKSPALPSYYAQLARRGRKSRIRALPVADQASAAPQDDFEGRRGQRSPLQAHSGTGIALAHVWFACPTAVGMRDARTCFGGKPRNFTTAGSSTMVISGAMPCNSGLIHTWALGP
jgi:hypothetical protein